VVLLDVVAGREDVVPLGVTKTTLVMVDSTDEVEVVVVDVVDVDVDEDDDEVVRRVEVEERVLLVVDGTLLVVGRKVVVGDVVGGRLEVVLSRMDVVDGLVVGLVVGESLVGDADVAGEPAEVVEGAAASLVNVLVTTIIGVVVTTMVAVVVDGASSRDEMMLDPLVNVCAVAPANMAETTANCLQTMVSYCDVPIVFEEEFRPAPVFLRSLGRYFVINYAGGTRPNTEIEDLRCVRIGSREKWQEVLGIPRNCRNEAIEMSARC
jgi:hypothetical protein